MNTTRITYVGGQASVEIRHDRRCYKFINRRPVLVPDALAEKLTGDMDFMPSDEVQRTVQERFPAGGPVVLRRWGALGDILIFRAAVAAAKRAMPFLQPILRCQAQFAGLFEADPLWTALWPMGRPLPRPIEPVGWANFDQTAEQDHVQQSPDRLTLFLQELVVEPVTLTPDDWRLPLPPRIGKWVQEHLGRRGLGRAQRRRPLVGVQVRGSGPMKSLPRPHVVALAAALSDHAEVILIEDRPDQVWEHPGVHSMTGRDALHAIELLRHCDLCVTMDSGVLWMAHAAMCPVLCVMGPTRPEQRITRHPLYPRGARAVRLNALPGIGLVVPLENGALSCPPCFEAGGACNKSFACMQKQPKETVVAAILTEALRMLAGDLPLPQMPAAAPPLAPAS